jgi:hypothetical protein
MSTDQTLDVPVYLQIEPRDRAYNYDTRRYDGPPRSAAVVATTVKRPTKPKAGTVVVKVTLRIPAPAFEPLRPEAVVVIPTDLTDPHPVEVEAQDPTAGAL